MLISSKEVEHLKEYIFSKAQLLKRFPKSILEFFDDASDIVINGIRILLKVDGFSFSRSKYEWCSYSDIGFKSISAAVSDVVAKGCRPYIYAISIGLTQNDIANIDDVIDGINNAIKIYGGYIVNIDTNGGNDSWIDVFIIGTCNVLPVPRRMDALNYLILPRKIGDSVIAYIYQYDRELVAPMFNIFEPLLKCICKPLVNLEITRVIEKHRACIVGSIDISDTFAETLYDLSMISQRGINLNISPTMVASMSLLNFYRELAKKRENIDLEELILMSNEEYIPILVVREYCINDLLSDLEYLGFHPMIIGYSKEYENDITWFGKKIRKVVWNHISTRIKGI